MKEKPRWPNHPSFFLLSKKRALSCAEPGELLEAVASYSLAAVSGGFINHLRAAANVKTPQNLFLSCSWFAHLWHFSDIACQQVYLEAEELSVDQLRTVHANLIRNSVICDWWSRPPILELYRCKEYALFTLSNFAYARQILVAWMLFIQAKNALYVHIDNQLL